MTSVPDLHVCEYVIGEPATAWAGRCFEIAAKFVAAGLVPGGVAVYGHWIGDVHRQSYFGNRAEMPFVQHGWIWIQDEGMVVDPTRWAFENRAPYIYVGREPDGDGLDPCMHCELIEEEHCDDGPLDQCGFYEVARWPYDEGGNVWRQASRGDPPPFNSALPPVPFKIEGVPMLVVRSLLRQEDVSTLSENQIVWLANTAYQSFKTSEVAAAVYEAICAAGDEENGESRFIELIPIDNRRKAQREGGFKRD